MLQNESEACDLIDLTLTCRPLSLKKNKRRETHIFHLQFHHANPNIKKAQYTDGEVCCKHTILCIGMCVFFPAFSGALFKRKIVLLYLHWLFAFMPCAYWLPAASSAASQKAALWLLVMGRLYAHIHIYSCIQLYSVHERAKTIIDITTLEYIHTSNTHHVHTDCGLLVYSFLCVSGLVSAVLRFTQGL